VRPPRWHRHLPRERRLPASPCPLYLTEGFQALSKIEVQANGRSILATLNIVDDPAIVAETEVGLSEDAYHQLGAAAGTRSRWRTRHRRPR